MYKNRLIGPKFGALNILHRSVHQSSHHMNFLICCIKLGDYKIRKMTEPDFPRKILIWRQSAFCLQINKKSTFSVIFRKHN